MGMANGQDYSERFRKYNWDNISPTTTRKHQLLVSVNYAIDVSPEKGDPGNVKPGYNAGIGLGYGYRVLFDGLKQSVTLGAKAEWYPGTMYKFNLLMELDALVISTKKNNPNLVVLSGAEGNFSFNRKFESGGSSLILYFLEANYGQTELKWGLHIGEDYLFVKPTSWTDWTLSVIKLTYRFNL
jgi:hypothetical protein